ncbi:hypothetical protein GF337_12130 [candidate division KSB1 bacterium]|nr:hypothetical protein [candidate division KSB1 bacterium]
MNRISRRHFIRNTGAIAGGIIITRPAFTKAKTNQKPDQIVPEYRTLGKTGLKVTTVGYGAMRTTDAAVVERALDLGINFVDTAHVYQGGNCEKMVGKVVSKRRKDVILCTKIKQDSEKDMIRMFEQSLRRLKTDYVDILYAHSMKKVDHIHNETTMNLFQRFKKEGKVRYIGFSTHRNEAALLNQAAEDRFWEVILVAYNFEKEKELTAAINKAANAGIGIVGMKTQAGGYETDTMGKLSPHQAALKWVLQNPNVHTTIPSMVTFDQLEENIQVMGKKMGWNDRKILNKYAGGINDRYCRSCGACKDVCPHGVDIPEVNRCYMYADGYNDLDLARINYRELAVSENAAPCENCEVCVARCKYGIALKDRMPRMNQLLA